MKSIPRSFVLIIAVAIVCTVIPADAQEATGGLRYTVTVTKFENQAGWHGQWDIGNAWGTVLTDMLNQTGKFIVLGETDMRAAALDEQDFAASGRTAGGKKAPVTGQMTPAQLLREITPDDLMSFGLIPELVGRLPVSVSVEPLDKEAMISILTEPKNALTRQFTRMLELDGVELMFTDDALEAVAEEAMGRKTGARGLRTIIEETLLEVMYEIPSRTDVVRCIVNGETIRRKVRPLLLTGSGRAVPWEEEELQESA